MTVVTWNPSDKGGSVTLSGGNLSAALTLSQAVRATLSRGLADAATWDWYYEATVSSINAPQSPLIGLGLVGANINKYPGYDAYGWSYYSTSGEKYNSSVSAAFGATYTVGDVIGVRYNSTTGLIKFYKNGVLIGTAYTAIGQNMYPMVGGGSTGANVSDVLGNFGASSFFAGLPSGCKSWDASQENIAPVASFTNTPSSGARPFNVAFTDTSTHIPTSWLWDFGDGAASNLQNPSHIYEVAGTYTVTLTATNAAGSSSVSTVCVTASGGQRRPLLAYNNLLEDDDATVTVSTEASGFEKENAYDWNPTTWWMPSAGGASWLRASFAEARACNYVAIYAQDLGTNDGYFKLQYSTDGGSVWLDAILAIEPDDTECVYRHFSTIQAADWRFYMNSATASAIGVIAFGLDFELEMGDYIGFSAPNMARDTEITNVVSDRGTLLGRTLVKQGSMLTLTVTFMTDAFAIDTWLPFMEHAELKPFFFVWNPDNRPSEAAFCWSNAKLGKPAYSNQGFLSTSLEMVARIK